MKAIAVNPAKRSAKKPSAKKSEKKTKPKKGTRTMASKNKAKKNPATRAAPRRNQAGKFKLTAAEVKSLSGAAAGGGVAGAVTGWVDSVKPPALDMIPSSVLTAAAGVLVVAMTRDALAKAVGYGMVASSVGDIVQEFMGNGTTTVTKEQTEEKGGGALVFSNPGHYGLRHNPAHARMTHNPGHYSAHSKHVGALVTF